jgi:hypothetical protein
LFCCGSKAVAPLGWRRGVGSAWAAAVASSDEAKPLSEPFSRCELSSRSESIWLFVMLAVVVAVGSSAVDRFPSMSGTTCPVERTTTALKVGDGREIGWSSDPWELIPSGDRATLGIR